MERVLIVGPGGAGKSWLAERIIVLHDRQAITKFAQSLA